MLAGVAQDNRGKASHLRLPGEDWKGMTSGKRRGESFVRWIHSLTEAAMARQWHGHSFKVTEVWV